MQKKLLILILFFCVLTVFSFPKTAMAKDVAGRLGVGMDNTLTASSLGIGAIPSSPNSNNAPSYGLSMKYWINNDWGIAGVLGFMYGTATAAQEGYNDPDGFWAFSLDLKGIYNFAKGDNANLGVYLNLHIRKESTTLARPAGPFHSNLGYALAIGLTPEVFITDNFAFVGEFGLTVRLQEGFAAGITGDNFIGGFGFHYYF